VLAVIADEQYSAFTMRLSDRFGDHGLIAVVIGHASSEDFAIDTWLMSCRVLKRQVEEEALNEIVRLARDRGCTKVVGRYIPTAKNGMVRDLYPKMRFAHSREESGGVQVYELDVAQFQAKPTNIHVNQEAYAAAGSNR
jgi:FkbH-like protein